jgi:hypothetical protein
MSVHWRREDPQWYNVCDLPWTAVDGPRLAHGVEGRLLSRSATDDGASLMLRLPPGWTLREPADEGSLELFLVHGSLTVDGTTVGAGGFVAVPRGCGTVELASETGADLFAFWNPRLPVEHCYGGQLRVTRTWQEDWLPYELPGLRHGIMYKPLRVPDVATGPLHGGPGGMLRLHLLTPGFNSPDQEYHHDCWEEIIFVSGDLLMPGRGFGGPGTLLNNPADYEHGPYCTSRGSVMLTHTVAPMPTSYTRMPGGPETIEHYLDTTSVLEPPCTHGWEERPEAEVLARFGGEVVPR